MEDDWKHILSRVRACIRRLSYMCRFIFVVLLIMKILMKTLIRDYK